jgi:outer membrane protein assembly factor BamB
MIRDGGIATCFNAEDGEIIYQERLGAAVAYFSSPVLAHDKIYVASRDGKVTRVREGTGIADQISFLF